MCHGTLVVPYAGIVIHFFNAAENYKSNWIRKKTDSVFQGNILFFCLSNFIRTLSEMYFLGESLELSAVGINKVMSTVLSRLLKESIHSVSNYALISQRSSALPIQKDSF